MHKRFYFLVVLRVALLVLTIFAFAFIFGKPDLLVNHLILGAIIVLQVVELIHFVNHTNRELSKIFQGIIHSDFSLTFQPSIKGRSFTELEKNFNRLLQAYRSVKIEREAQYLLLQRLVSQINVGIIAVHNNEDISLFNSMAEHLLEIRGIKNWNILRQVCPLFVKYVEETLGSGRRLVELPSASGMKVISLDVSSSILLDQPHWLILIQDINREIEQKELEAWLKLIRILTHEIMNSVTPISSLTETTREMLRRSDGNPRKVKELNDDIIQDILFSVETIQKRSDGLLNFVDTYRKLSRIPNPVTAAVNVNDLLVSVQRLMLQEAKVTGVSLKVDVEDGVSTIMIDQSLVEQVLINLIGNSIHALEGIENPTITLRAGCDLPYTIIQVRDNGRGIPAKELDHIFVPFFSTRKGGSGIGLSLSKQIMSLHQGRITVSSKVGEGATFTLWFKA